MCTGKTKMNEEEKNLILLVSPCRSGSTALLYSFAQIQDTKTYYQPIKGTIRENIPFRMPDISEGIHIFKETLGHENKKVCTYNPFKYIPKKISYKTLFLFREPINTWHSWINIGWNPKLELFLEAYSSAFKLYKKEKSRNFENTTCIAIEELNSRNIEKYLKEICKRLDLQYNKKMLYWGDNTDLSKFTFLTDINKKVSYDCSKLLIKSKGLIEIKEKSYTEENNLDAKKIEKKLRKKYIFITDEFKHIYQK